MPGASGTVKLNPFADVVQKSIVPANTQRHNETAQIGAVFKSIFPQNVGQNRSLRSIDWGKKTLLNYEIQSENDEQKHNFYPGHGASNTTLNSPENSAKKTIEGSEME